MTAKSITLALAATTAAAALAEVVEVKFTVKTESEGKVVSKTISGIYDSDTEKNVFWSVQKVNGKNAKVAYDNTYFGLVNDTVATQAKKYGQNAELIWGDDNENVLVAGAWGKAASKSGQVAGMLDNVPATGTWSAKVNTKTYAQLLAAAGLSQTENRETSVIDGADEKIAEAEAAAAEKIAAAEKERDEKIAAAEELAKSNVEAANAAIAEAQTACSNQIAAIEQELNDKTGKLNDADALIAQYVEDLAATNAVLAAKATALEEAEAQLETIEGAINDVNDPELPNMISDYLEKTETEAIEMKDDALKAIKMVEDAYTAYTNALDLTDVSNAVQDAQDAYDFTNGLYEAACARYDALVYTNKMIGVVFEGTLSTWYDGEKKTINGKITETGNAITAAGKGYVAYTNYLHGAIDKLVIGIGDAKSGLIQAEQKAHDDYITASNELATVNAAIDNFPKAAKDWDTSYEQHDTYDKFLENNGGLEKFDGEVKARTEYNKYCSKQYEDALKKLTDTDLPKAKSAESDKRKAWDGGSVDADGYATDGALKTLQDAQKQLKKYSDELAKAEESEDFADKYIYMGSAPTPYVEGAIKQLKEELEDLNKQLADLDVENEFWTNCAFSAADKEEVGKDLKDAEEAKGKFDSEKGKAKKTLEDAQSDYNKQVGDQATKLKALAVEIGMADNGLDAVAGDIEAIRTEVDKYLNAPLGGVDGYQSLNDMVAAGERMLAAIANIRASLKLD